MSGIPKKQIDKGTGTIGYSIFAWGGFCSIYNPFVPEDKNPPGQWASVKTLLGSTFTPLRSGKYRVTAEIELHGDGGAWAGPGSLTILASLIPGKAGTVLGLIDPKKLIPSVVTAKNVVVLSVQSAETINATGFSNLIADTVIRDKYEVVFSGNPVVETTVQLTAGKQVRILAGLKTDVKAWGNASTVIKPLNSQVKRITVQEL